MNIFRGFQLLDQLETQQARPFVKRPKRTVAQVLVIIHVKITCLASMRELRRESHMGSRYIVENEVPLSSPALAVTPA
jgi:hypothetical protein